MQFPILSFIVFTPIVSGLLILLIPADRKTEVRVAALAAGAFALILSLWAYFSYDIAAGGYQFVEKYTWLPALGHLLSRWSGWNECPAGPVDRCGDVHRCADLLGDR